MAKHGDWSVHFTPKGQSVPQILGTLNDWLNSPEAKELLGIGSECETDEDYPVVLHHCFMRKSDVELRGFSTEICDGLQEVSCGNQVCWNGVSEQNIETDRHLMLQNLQRVGGVAIFIGDIIDGVEEEYELCGKIGVSIVTLDLIP